MVFLADPTFDLDREFKAPLLWQAKSEWERTGLRFDFVYEEDLCVRLLGIRVEL